MTTEVNDGANGDGGNGNQQAAETKTYSNLEDVFKDYPKLKEEHEKDIESKSDNRLQQALETMKAEEKEKEIAAKLEAKPKPGDKAKPLTTDDVAQIVADAIAAKEQASQEENTVKGEFEKIGLGEMYKAGMTTVDLAKAVGENIDKVIAAKNKGFDSQPPKVGDDKPGPLSDFEQQASAGLGVNAETWQKRKNETPPLAEVPDRKPKQ